MIGGPTFADGFNWWNINYDTGADGWSVEDFLVKIIADTTPPTISSVLASNITSSGATITWSTNEAADSQVEYGLTTAYGSQTTLNATVVTSHSVVVSGLSANTTYNYRVKSKDAAGNLALSSNFTFTTASSSAGVITAASCSSADVQAAINLAVDGNRVLIPAGSCTWTSGISISNKGISIEGAGISATTIVVGTSGGRLFVINLQAADPTFVLTGITFDGNNLQLGSQSIIDISYPTSGTNTNAFRIHHNEFLNLFDTAIEVNMKGTIGSSLIDHNTFQMSAGSGEKSLELFGANNGDYTSFSHPFNVGANEFIFIEDNTFTYAQNEDGAVDSYHGSRWVFRHNTVTNTNLGNHGADSGNFRGVHSFEIYENTFNRTASGNYRSLFFRSGSGVVFNNTFTGNYYGPEVANYRSRPESFTPWGACDGTSIWDENQAGKAGYACLDQIGHVFTQNSGGVNTIEGLYYWNNTLNGVTITSVGVSEASMTNHLQDGRDFFSNTQKPGYITYTYPHPLQGGTSSSSDTTPPSVSISSPSLGSTVSGTVTVSANAFDNIGVAGVQFLLDGVSLGAEDTTSPYTVSWNTASSTNTSHTLTARARDAAGNQTTSAVVSVTVSNVTSLSGQIIDPSRRTDWSNAGVEGGIPNRTTICQTLNPGVTATQINNAITSCSNAGGGVVYLNPGSYSISGSIRFAGAKNVTLRGAGADQTKLTFSNAGDCGNGASAGVICIDGSSRIWAQVSSPVNWIAGYSQGTTQITLASVSGLQVGQTISLDQCDDGRTGASCTGAAADLWPDVTNCNDIRTCSIEGGAYGDARREVRGQSQAVKIVDCRTDHATTPGLSCNSASITISQGLHMPNWRSGQSPQVWSTGTYAQLASGDGIEDFSITFTFSNAGTLSGVNVVNAYNAWIKGMRFIGPAGVAHVWIEQSVNVEIRDNYFYGSQGASTSYGVFITPANNVLVVNNIFHRVVTMIHSGPGSGNVLAYNWGYDNSRSDYPTAMGVVASNHESGIGMNLWEGNEGTAFVADTFHGNANFETFFRNQLTGADTINFPNSVQCTHPISIWALHRFFNVVGNVLGLS
ncbi:MAG: Ig-like domain-containing protein, partial [Thermoleophilia bacterium]